MKIYTKTGDKGTTSLIGGIRVKKDSVRVEAYGETDELISWIGVLCSYKETSAYGDLLRSIQENLMICAALLADDENSCKKLPSVSNKDILALEVAIDTMEESLTPLKSFVLPSAPVAAAMCHVARSVCRRAERRAVSVAQQSSIDENVLSYLNRLSDYLFTLARKLVADNGKTDNCWIPDL